jgi:uncharacterized protein YndB with AHSA1/START domain
MTYSVEVSVRVGRAPAEVLAYFTQPDRYTQWMGSEAKLDPVPGGEYRLRMPDGFEAAGSYVAVDSPHQVSFTWGFADEEAAAKTKNPHGPTGATSASVMPAGSTTVMVTLAGTGDGATLVTLRHDGLPTPELRDGHQVAWDTYLPRLAIAVAGGDPGADPHS